MNGLFLIAAGGAAWLLLGSSSKPAAAKPTTPRPNGAAASFQARIADALSRGDANELHQIANEMQAQGRTAEAEALRASATALQSMGAIGRPGSTSPTSPGQPVLTPSPAIPSPPIATTPKPPSVTLPQVVIPQVVIPSATPIPPGVSITPEQQERLARAQSTAMHLRNSSRYKEDKNLVKAFQQQEGLVADGLYGPKSGLALSYYGIVPPRPFYWSSKTMKADKADYTSKMLEHAKLDPARAADWTAASKVANDPAK